MGGGGKKKKKRNELLLVDDDDEDKSYESDCSSFSNVSIDRNCICSEKEAETKKIVWNEIHKKSLAELHDRKRRKIENQKATAARLANENNQELHDEAAAAHAAAALAPAAD